MYGDFPAEKCAVEYGLESSKWDTVERNATPFIYEVLKLFSSVSQEMDVHSSRLLYRNVKDISL